MKTRKLLFVLLIAGICVSSYYSFAKTSLSLIEENVNALVNAPLGGKTGIPIITYDEKGETATSIIIEQTTRCMPGGQQVCHAGTQIIYQLKVLP